MAAYYRHHGLKWTDFRISGAGQGVEFVSDGFGPVTLSNQQVQSTGFAAMVRCWRCCAAMPWGSWCDRARKHVIAMLPRAWGSTCQPVWVLPPALPCQGCAYSDGPYKCQVDVSIEVEQKASSITTNGFSIDGRIG